MKVLFTLDSLGVGGAETSTLDLIHNFSRNAKVAVCYFYDQHDLKKQYVKGPCNLFYLALPGRYSFLEGVSKLKKLVLQEKFDLIVTSLYRASIMSRIVSFLTGIPLIDTMITDSYGHERKKEFNGLPMIKFGIVYLLDRLTSFIPKIWISNSKCLAKSVGKQLSVPDNKIKVIYRGRQGDMITTWKSPLSADFHFASIGRLIKSKGQVDLIHAFNSMHQKFPNTYLTIYGEGPERRALEKVIFDLDLRDFIFLRGRTAQAWNQLYQAHCFVLPSRYEGFSGALVEALMTGIPVIASDIPMNKEAVIHDQNGLLYAVNDQADLQLKMEEVITHFDAAIQRGRVARQEALVKYDIRKIATEYEAVLQQCAGASS